VSALERLLGEFAAQGAPSGARAAAAAALRAHGLPTRRDENWHYADLRALEGVAQFRSTPALPPPVARGATAPLPALPELPEPLAGYTRLVFVDGLLSQGWPPQQTPGLTRLPLEPAPVAQPAVTDYESGGDGRMALIARMFAPEPLALQLTGSAALEIVHVASSAAANCHTRVSIEIAAGASVQLVERQLGCPGAAADGQPPAALHCTYLELRIGAGSQLMHTRLHQATGNSLRFSTLAADLAADAGYVLRHVAAGDGSERSSAQIRLQGRAAAVQIQALAAARGAQAADLQFTVVHEAAATHSEQVFRGIASDRAHVSCSADVQVAASAPGARVQQTLRGLIDGKGAAVNLRPRLTINTNEVQAKHGATTGRLDEDLLFYLLARGLEPATARSLLKWALLAEVLAAIEPPALRRAAELATAAQLRDAPATELLQ
jgi:Fe-S cluster assembly protein SufD